MSEFNVSLVKCGCCETSVLSFKEELIRSEEERDLDRGRIAMCDLPPDDVVDLFMFCKHRLEELSNVEILCDLDGIDGIWIDDKGGHLNRYG